MIFLKRAAYFFLYCFVFLFVFTVSLSGQNKELKAKRILLNKDFLSKLKPPSENIFLMKTAALEDTRSFFVINFKEQKYDTVIAKLKSINEHSKIWVDTLAILGSQVLNSDIQELADYLEHKTYETSKDNTKGIFTLVSSYFGEPPNIDENGVKGRGDGKTNVLITDIKDGLDSTNEYIPGYFNYEDVDIKGNVSNKMDLIYIDSYPGILYQGTRNIKKTLPTIAHEFQHLIHWNYDPKELPFLDESMSFLSEIFCGFRTQLPEEYFSNTKIPLFDWNSDNTKINESRATLFGEYLREQCGDGFIKYFISNPNTGAEGIDSAIVVAGLKNLSFEKLFTNWAIANYVNDKIIDPRYGYNYKFYNKPVPIKTNKNPNIFSDIIGVNNLAPVYLKYTMAESLAAVFHYNKNIVIKALEIGNSNFGTYDISTNNYFVQNNYGTLYNDIVFVCLNLNNNNYNCDTITYTSYGKRSESYTEIAYDDGEPENYGLSGEVGLKRFVKFRIPPGKQLDSIKFGFKTGGKALFHIYKSTDTSIYPIDNIIPPLMITVTDTFPKWTKVDLTPFKIIPAYDIAAGYELLPSDAPYPAIWGDNTNILDRSIVYFPSLSSWRSINTNYLIRAYLSDFILKVERNNNVLPLNFKLFQNYPNPFNGTTTIRFDLIKRQKIKLRIYDLLGKEVSTLVDESLDAGSYSVKWYGKNKYAVNVPSGLYIYCLETSEERVFRKLIYLK
jgi:hypothetical protein